MAKTTRIFRVTRDAEDAVAKELADFYNRQGFIGNTVSRAITVAAGNDLVISVFAEGKEDDGRQLDGIEERRKVKIVRITPGEENAGAAEIAKFYNEENALDRRTSRATIVPAGEDVIYIMFSDKGCQPDDLDDDEDEDYEDDDQDDSTSDLTSTEDDDEDDEDE